VVLFDNALKYAKFYKLKQTGTQATDSLKGSKHNKQHKRIEKIKRNINTTSKSHTKQSQSKLFFYMFITIAFYIFTNNKYSVSTSTNPAA
jgi:F0F1-type ATP synthase membrane subunit a